VNWRHLGVFVWLRWRIMNNQWRRGGALNAVLMLIVAIGVLSAAVPLLITTFLLGLHAIPRAAPEHLMYAWDALILAFLFFWSIGLITELQRSEPLALSKFLHLPVSVSGAFLINYLSSLARLSLILYVPAMLGYALALVVVRGWMLVFTLPLLAAFLLMITALTYQLQGWLGSLMSNPRRRRTAIMMITAVFVLVCQSPQLVNFYSVRVGQQVQQRRRADQREMEELDRALLAGGADIPELMRRKQELVEKHRREAERARRERREPLMRAAWLANLCVPVGWLPLGVMTAVEGAVTPSLLGCLGMTLIGSASLWRAHRATVREYQGQATNGKTKRAQAAASAARSGKPRELWIEARLPGLSEPVSAIALGGFLSILRAPEAKMVLLTPVFLIPVFGAVLFQGRPAVPEIVRPLFAAGAMLVILFGLLQLMVNQFGFDRGGFRAFVLSAARRRDILLGKNLSVLPVAAAMALVLCPIVAWLYPLRLDHALALFPQFLSMYLMLCMLTNPLSIFAPYPLPAGTMKPTNLKVAIVLVQVLVFLFLFPLTQALTLVPLGLEALAHLMGWAEGVPICLLLSLAGCAAVILIYALSLKWLGTVLQAREQKILEIITSKV
jgi:hypothetical protein